MKKYRFLLVLLIRACVGLSSFSLSADYFFIPPISSYPTIVYRDSYGVRFGDSSGEGVLYLMCKTIIDKIDHKKFCCALLGTIVAVWAHSIWPDSPEYGK